MHFHVRIRHWVISWCYVGIVCGAVALVNIFFRDLSPTQVRVTLIIGALFWLLGGLACYGFEGVKIEPPVQPPCKGVEPPSSPQQKEWRSASEFLLPGNRKSLLPPRY
jgi:hypothetical protein